MIKKKIVFLGESTTGKTTIAYRLVKKEFMEDSMATIGANFMLLSLDNIKYEIWDTAGQERYLSLVEMYYRNTNIILLVFDLNNLSTIDRLNYYLKKILNDLDNEYRILIIGNKLDLIDKRELSKIDDYVKKKTSMYPSLLTKMEYIYISAKTGENFNGLVDKIKIYGQIVDQEIHKDIIKIENINIEPNNGYCYC
jgi:small GTP-binding protein